MLEVYAHAIKELTGLHWSQVVNKIDAEIKNAGGILTREAAAHLVANELGIKVSRQETRHTDVLVITFIASRRYTGERIQ